MSTPRRFSCDFRGPARGWSGEPGRIAFEGGSAGKAGGRGVESRARSLGRGLCHRAFVDVLHTMLDPDLPLTPLEWPEWGNPVASREAFDTIRAYCPYQMFAPGLSPVLATAGVGDPRRRLLGASEMDRRAPP